MRVLTTLSQQLSSKPVSGAGLKKPKENDGVCQTTTVEDEKGELEGFFNVWFDLAWRSSGTCGDGGGEEMGMHKQQM